MSLLWLFLSGRHFLPVCLWLAPSSRTLSPASTLYRKVQNRNGNFLYSHVTINAQIFNIQISRTLCNQVIIHKGRWTSTCDLAAQDLNWILSTVSNAIRIGRPGGMTRRQMGEEWDIERAKMRQNQRMEKCKNNLSNDATIFIRETGFLFNKILFHHIQNMVT